MKNLINIFTFLFLATISSCVGDKEPNDEEILPNLRTLSGEEKDLASSSSRFAVDLYQRLRDIDDPNLFFSPFSIQQALSMAMNGNEGGILEEYLQTLRFEGMTLADANQGNQMLTQFLKEVDPKVKLNIANGIWYRKGLTVQSTFSQTLALQYLAAQSELDMGDPSSVNIINDWIAQQTENMIQDMLDSLDPSAAMYLVNAIYFQGDWKYRFEQNATAPAPFHLSPTQSVTVEMMTLPEAADLKYHKEAGMTYLEIPYSTGQYSMGIVLPDEGDLEWAEDLITTENISAWKDNAHEMAIKLKMPKFNMRMKFDNLSKYLKAMGLVTPFSNHPENFSQMFQAAPDNLRISRVIHDAAIEVDEKGTKAAAATVVEVILTAVPAGPMELTLDRPFVFFIQEKHSGALLFMGRLADPSKL